VNHPTLVNFSGQPSISSVNFSPFTSVDFLTASDIRPVPRLNLQPNNLGGTAKKITTSTYRKCVAPTQERKIKQAQNAKPVDFRRKLFLVLQEEGRERIAGIQLRLKPHQIRART
jgi:hypothetical protein